MSTLLDGSFSFTYHAHRQPNTARRALIERGGADEAAAAFGIELPARSREAVLVLPENWDAVRAFCAVQTQWRHGPSGHPTGLDYAGCKAPIEMLCNLAKQYT